MTEKFQPFGFDLDADTQARGEQWQQEEAQRTGRILPLPFVIAADGHIVPNLEEEVGRDESLPFQLSIAELDQK